MFDPVRALRTQRRQLTADDRARQTSSIGIHANRK